MSGSASGGGGAVVRQGHLRKLKTMKKKFFVLRGETEDSSARLEYYESEKKFRTGAAPRRALPLSACYDITRRLDLKQRHVIALFTREEQFCVVAENEAELHAWLAALLREHHSDDASQELLHPIQHVWQVNVQKKGLGAVKNIHGLYNLCLTDKTLTLVKIKSHNNVISDIAIPETIKYSLKNIRRCGDSECFFYMEVGRQTSTGAGELWMHSEDTNIAQSMHSTIYLAMRDCAKETENERDHIVIPNTEPSTNKRRSTISGRSALHSEKGLCVGACMAQCVCAGTESVEESAAHAPLAALAAAECQHNPLTEFPERVIKHHRTVSLPTGCPPFAEAPRVSHERTRSAPLAGELDAPAPAPAADLHASGEKKGRRASMTRLCKLSPAHAKNAQPSGRNRCESMPSKPFSSYEVERPQPRHIDIEGAEAGRDEPDAAGEWHRTPRIPEEPDLCDNSRDLFKSFKPEANAVRAGSIQHSRTSSLGGEEDGYLAMAPRDPPAGYLPMAPGHDPPAGYLPMAPGHDPLGGLISASSGSVCSGTPSTDPRFSEYQLEPATSHLAAEARPPRAYSVGSRPAPRAEARHRAYSVGARARPPPPAPHRPRASAEDLMLLDFSNNTPKHKPVADTPPHGSLGSARGDEYVDMSPRNAGYVEMRPGDVPAPAPATPDGYVEMTCGSRTRPIAIAAARAPPPAAAAASPPDRFRRKLETHGSQIFQFSESLESPMSPETDFVGEVDHLATVREAAEDPRPADTVSNTDACGVDVPARSPEPAGEPQPPVAHSPAYVTLAVGRRSASPSPDLPANPTANKCLARNDSADNKGGGGGGCAAPVVVAGGGAAARFALGAPAALHYAALDLEPRRAPAAPAPRAYTQIDFVRSEKLHAADGT